MAYYETKSSSFDIKKMSDLLIDKSTIGTPILAQIDKFNFNKYAIVNPQTKSKRILNNCTVRYLCQSYFYDENNKNLKLLIKTIKI